MRPFHPARQAADLIGDESLWDDWALHPGAAAELDARLATLRPGVVLEAGSGSSTLVLARYARASGARVISLEHDQRFAVRTAGLLKRHGLAGTIELVVAPLKPAAAGPWYDTQLPDGIGFALIDGPRLADGGRAAALGQLRPNLGTNWELWLDDAGREGEQAAVAAWKRDHGIAAEHLRFGRGVMRVTPQSAARRLIDASDIVVTLLTGRRPALLNEAVSALHVRASGLLETAEVVALHNGGDTATSHVLKTWAQLINRTDTTWTLLGIGQAVSRLAALATASGRRYWLHLEDDWTAVTTADGWLDEARCLLAEPSVAQVRMRHRGEPVLGEHMVTGQPITWQAGDVALSAEAHWTFNPALVRTADIGKVYPAEGERAAQRRAHLAGLRRIAQLHPGVFTHTGQGRSLRQETRCPA